MTGRDGCTTRVVVMAWDAVPLSHRRQSLGRVRPPIQEAATLGRRVTRSGRHEG